MLNVYIKVNHMSCVHKNWRSNITAATQSKKWGSVEPFEPALPRQGVYKSSLTNFQDTLKQSSSRPLHWSSLLCITIICTVKWQATLYQCIYKYECWNVFMWACDDELITVSSILLPILSVLTDNYWAPECTKITRLVINFFQEQQNSRRFPVFPGVVDTLRGLWHAPFKLWRPTDLLDLTSFSHPNIKNSRRNFFTCTLGGPKAQHSPTRVNRPPTPGIYPNALIDYLSLFYGRRR